MLWTSVLISDQTVMLLAVVECGSLTFIMYSVLWLLFVLFSKVVCCVILLSFDLSGWQFDSVAYCLLSLFWEDLCVGDGESSLLCRFCCVVWKKIDELKTRIFFFFFFFFFFLTTHCSF